jgi:hypothetical protein
LPEALPLSSLLFSSRIDIRECTYSLQLHTIIFFFIFINSFFLVLFNSMRVHFFSGRRSNYAIIAITPISSIVMTSELGKLIGYLYPDEKWVVENLQMRDTSRS